MPFRYDYCYGSQRLIVHFPNSATHEVTTTHFVRCLSTHLDTLQTPQGRRVRYLLSGHLTTKIAAPPGGSDLEFIADVTLKNKGSRTVYIVEVAFAQTKANARKKVEARLKVCPTMVGAIVVNFTETPRWSGPTTVADAPREPKSPEDWEVAIAGAPDVGPIIVNGNRWLEEMMCEVEVWLRDDTKLVTTEQVCDPIRHISISNAFCVLASYTCTSSRHPGPRCRPFNAMAPDCNSASRACGGGTHGF